MSENRRRQPRERDREYLGWVARLPCAACMSMGKFNRRVQVAHLRIPSAEHGKRETGKAEKPSDKWTLPLCAPHHQGDVRAVRLSQDDHGEAFFWESFGINPFELCLALNRAYAEGRDGGPVVAHFAALGRRTIQGAAL